MGVQTGMDGVYELGENVGGWSAGGAVRSRAG